jgi:hypothetical protein
LYSLWDELLRTHPKLEIDNANWRITGPDIEAMSRSIGSLTRTETDINGFPHGAIAQSNTLEVSLWTPISTEILQGFDPYVVVPEKPTKQA